MTVQQFQTFNHYGENVTKHPDEKKKFKETMARIRSDMKKLGGKDMPYRKASKILRKGQ